MESKPETIIAYSIEDERESFINDLLEGNNESFNEEVYKMGEDDRKETAQSWWESCSSDAWGLEFEMENLYEYYKTLPTNWFYIGNEIQFFHPDNSRHARKEHEQFFWFLFSGLDDIESVKIEKIGETDSAIELFATANGSNYFARTKTIFCLKHEPESDGRMISDFMYTLACVANDFLDQRKVLPKAVYDTEGEIWRFFTDFGMTPEIANAIRKHDIYRMCEASFNRLETLERVNYADEFLRADISTVKENVLDAIKCVLMLTGVMR